MKNMFPFELNFEGKFIDNFFGNCAFVLSTIMLIGFYATFDGSHKDGIAIFVLISGIISSIFLTSLLFIPFSYLKFHIACETFSFVFVFVSCSSAFLLNLFYYNQYHNIINIFGLIISLILSLGILIMIFNPKLSLKVSAKESTNEKGEIIYSRPKFISLAFTEWVNYFAIFVNEISILLFVISIK